MLLTKITDDQFGHLNTFDTRADAVGNTLQPKLRQLITQFLASDQSFAAACKGKCRCASAKKDRECIGDEGLAPLKRLKPAQ